MTAFRTFEPHDTPWTLAGIAFGLFYGAMFVALIAFWGQGILLLLVLSLPFIAVQLILNIGLDRFAKWRRRDDLPPAPIPWLRHHSISLGAAIGAGIALILTLLGAAR